MRPLGPLSRHARHHSGPPYGLLRGPAYSLSAPFPEGGRAAWPKNSLAAILAGDIVGYSTSRRAKLIEQHEGRTDFYSARYAYADSELAGELRREVYGEHSRL